VELTHRKGMPIARILFTLVFTVFAVMVIMNVLGGLTIV